MADQALDKSSCDADAILPMNPRDSSCRWAAALPLMVALFLGLLSAGAAAADYLLGPGDKLRISVFGRQDLSGEHSVLPSGSLSLPLAGDVHASNITIGELRSKLTDIYTTLVQGPSPVSPAISVQVEIVRFRAFYILGDVSKPGSYQYENGLTVLRAVAIAGGYASAGADARISEIRARENLDVLLNRYLAGVAREARLIAERDKLDEISFSPDLLDRQHEPFVAEILDVESQLFTLRRDLLDRELEIISRRQSQFGEEDDALQTQALAVERKRRAIDNLLASIEALISRGVMPKSEQFSLLIMQADVERESREIVVSRSRAKQGMSAMDQEALILAGERQREITSELELVRLNLDESLLRMRAEAERLAILKVREFGGSAQDGEDVRPRITRERAAGGIVVLDATIDTPVLPGDVVEIPHVKEEGHIRVPDRAVDPRALFRPRPAAE